MGKPSYTGCPDRCSGLHPKRCWQLGHIPFVGYLARSQKSQRSAWICVSERYMRRKQFLWPDEVADFCDLYREKHPELISRAVLEAMSDYRHFGAVYKPYEKDWGTVITVFGRNGIFDWPVITPKPKDREKAFFKLASNALTNLARGA